MKTLIKVLVAIALVAMLIPGFTGCTENQSKPPEADDSALLAENTSLKTQLAELQADLTTTRANYDTVLAESTSSKTQLAELQADLTTARANYDTVLAESTSSKTQLAELQADLTTAQANYDTVLAESTSSKTHLAELQSALTTAQAIYDALKVEYDASPAQDEGGITIAIVTSLSITVNPSGGGSVIQHPAPMSGGTYSIGAKVILTAVPSPDTNCASWSFISWTGEIASYFPSPTSPVVTVNMDGNRSGTANFEMTWFCPYCDARPTFDNIEELNAHIRSEHPDEPEFIEVVWK